jgi:hypothetical protein
MFTLKREAAMYAEILEQLQDITWLNSKSQSYTSFNQPTDFHEAWHESHATGLDMLGCFSCDWSK